MSCKDFLVLLFGFELLLFNNCLSNYKILENDQDSLTFCEYKKTASNFRFSSKILFTILKDHAK